MHDENFATFDAALCTWREEIIQRTDAAQVNLQWDIDELHTDYFLSPRQRINLDRILRESFTNILKHALPQTIIVSINIHKENMQITITDDGIRSDSSQWQANTGLYSLHTRAKEIKATLAWTLPDDLPTHFLKEPLISYKVKDLLPDFKDYQQRTSVADYYPLGLI